MFKDFLFVVLYRCEKFISQFKQTFSIYLPICKKTQGFLSHSVNFSRDFSLSLSFWMACHVPVTLWRNNLGTHIKSSIPWKLPLVERPWSLWGYNSKCSSGCQRVQFEMSIVDITTWFSYNLFLGYRFLYFNRGMKVIIVSETRKKNRIFVIIIVIFLCCMMTKIMGPTQTDENVVDGRPRCDRIQWLQKSC